MFERLGEQEILVLANRDGNDQVKGRQIRVAILGA
jgi:hypothetical protein